MDRYFIDWLTSEYGITKEIWDDKAFSTLSGTGKKLYDEFKASVKDEKIPYEEETEEESLETRGFTKKEKAIITMAIFSGIGTHKALRSVESKLFKGRHIGLIGFVGVAALHITLTLAGTDKTCDLLAKLFSWKDPKSRIQD